MARWSFAQAWLALRAKIEGELVFKSAIRTIV